MRWAWVPLPDPGGPRRMMCTLCRRMIAKILDHISGITGEPASPTSDPPWRHPPGVVRPGRRGITMTRMIIGVCLALTVAQAVTSVTAALASAARQSLLAAYRYQRLVDVPVVLTLDVKRFPDAAVLAAIAERAVVTTLVTSEGRALTEVVLWVRNRAQPFVKIALPAGASMLSAEVAGAPAKPVEAKDGDRVPLLRPGFRPDGPYMVSFVYLHAGAPFAKKGDMQMTLPKMDLPIDLVEWELFVPDQYRADRFDGNVLNADLINRSGAYDRISVGYGSGVGSGLGAAAPATAGPGQIGGRVVDQQGAALPGVTVVAEGSQQRQSAVTDANGAFVLSGLPSGPIAVTGQLAGF